jgi:hypothetical protein
MRTSVSVDCQRNAVGERVARQVATLLVPARRVDRRSVPRISSVLAAREKSQR